MPQGIVFYASGQTGINPPLPFPSGWALHRSTHPNSRYMDCGRCARSIAWRKVAVAVL
jgi:hypothetical protein